jgi:ABC-type nitrate/sulfonate/bicarbonate transport system substrate-binding protein
MADFFLAFYHAPIFVAEQKGWYKAAGISVGYSTGTGSDNTAAQVSAGRETFGLVGADAVARAVAHGEAVTAVAQLIDNSGLCAVVRANSGLNTIAQLAGKSYASAPGSLTSSLLPELEKAAGLKSGAIDLVPASYTAIIPSYLQGKFVSIGGFDYGEVLEANHEGVPSKCISFAA